MEFFARIYYLILFLKNFYGKNYEKAAEMLLKAVKHDNKPFPKIINYDALVSNLSDKIYEKEKFRKYTPINKGKKTLILNTEIYDTGGHTECVLRHIEQNKGEEFYFFLMSRGMESNKTAPVKSALIKSYVKDYFEFAPCYPYLKRTVEAFNYVIENKITNIIVNIHTNDVAAACFLALIKKYTDIEISFWNHADHYFCLATSFADKIYTRCKGGRAVCPYLRNNNKAVSGTFVVDFSDIKQISDEEIFDMKKNLGISENSFVTLTGCLYRKIGKEYFKFIKQLLKREENIVHILITEKIYHDKIRKEINSKNLILLDLQSEFYKFIQMSDLFIDSFPQGGALTLVDFIKYKKPVVIRVNEKHPEKSFEEYLYEEYEYTAKTTEEMLEKIHKISSDKEEYERISKKVYEFAYDKYGLK